MRLLFFALAITLLPAQATANDWEKFYSPFQSVIGIPSTTAPEMLPSTGDFEKDIESMFRRGFVPIGMSSFNTGNSKTDDAKRLAAKLHARYLVVSTALTSSQQSAIPLTMPTTTTSYSNGNVSAYGSGGYANGTYSGTTTTYGSRTTYFPITINRFDKSAIFFQESPRKGTGIWQRELTPEEMANVGTRHAFVVRFVRDGSPAYEADIFPGDTVLTVNGEPVNREIWSKATDGPQPMKVHLLRKGEPRDIEITVPPEWQGVQQLLH